MVNNQNPYLNLFPDICPPPANESPDRDDCEIGSTVLWNLNELVEIALKHNEDLETIKLVTRKAERDYENLLENGFDLIEAVKQLTAKGRYKGSYWCKTSPPMDRNRKRRGNGCWIPCDAYIFKMPYEHPKTGHPGTAEYFFKVCKGLEGSVVFFVSLHL